MKDDTLFLPPSWLPVEPWNEYKKMRVRIRKPLTNYAARIAVERLIELRAEGHPPDLVLKQSIFNSWQGLFPIKNGNNGNGELNKAAQHLKSVFR